MKNLKVIFGLSYMFVKCNDETMLVPSAVLTTIMMLTVVTFVPQLIPLIGQR